MKILDNKTIMEALFLKYGYLMLFPISMIEGQASTLLCGFLISTGFFNLWIVFFIIWFADICNDNMYYWIGRGLFKSSRITARIDNSKFLSTHLELMKRLRLKHPIKTMIFGKNAYMISIAIVASAGMVKLPYRRFLMYSIPASLIQPIILLFVGYHLGNGYMIASSYVKYPGIAVMIIFVIILLFYRQIGKYVAKFFNK